MHGVGDVVRSVTTRQSRPPESTGVGRRRKGNRRGGVGVDRWFEEVVSLVFLAESVSFAKFPA